MRQAARRRLTWRDAPGGDGGARRVRVAVDLRRMDVLLPFAAAVLSLRLAAALVRRWRGAARRSSSPGASRSPASPPRPARSPGAPRPAGTTALPGLLPLRRTAHRRAARRRLAASCGRPRRRARGLVYAGLAIGVALAVPIDPPSRGTRSPTRRSISSSSPPGCSRSSGTSAGRSPRSVSPSTAFADAARQRLIVGGRGRRRGRQRGCRARRGRWVRLHGGRGRAALRRLRRAALARTRASPARGATGRCAAAARGARCRRRPRDEDRERRRARSRA